MGFTKSRDLLAAAAWSLGSEVSAEPIHSSLRRLRKREGEVKGGVKGVKGSVPSLWDRPPVPMEPLFSGTWQLGSGTRALAF